MVSFGGVARQATTCPSQDVGSLWGILDESLHTAGPVSSPQVGSMIPTPGWLPARVALGFPVCGGCPFNIARPPCPSRVCQQVWGET